MRSVAPTGKNQNLPGDSWIQRHFRGKSRGLLHCLCVFGGWSSLESSTPWIRKPIAVSCHRFVVDLKLYNLRARNWSDDVVNPKSIFRRVWRSWNRQSAIFWGTRDCDHSSTRARGWGRRKRKIIRKISCGKGIRNTSCQYQILECNEEL
jgi:hypothetical protein